MLKGRVKIRVRREVQGGSGTIEGRSRSANGESRRASGNFAARNVLIFSRAWWMAATPLFFPMPPEIPRSRNRFSARRRRRGGAACARRRSAAAGADRPELSLLRELRHPRPGHPRARGRPQARAAAHPPRAAPRRTTAASSRWPTSSATHAVPSARRRLHRRRARGAGQQALPDRGAGKLRQHLHRRSRGRAALHRMPADRAGAQRRSSTTRSPTSCRATTGATRSPCAARQAAARC